MLLETEHSECRTSHVPNDGVSGLFFIDDRGKWAVCRFIGGYITLNLVCNYGDNKQHSCQPLSYYDLGGLGELARVPN